MDEEIQQPVEETTKVTPGQEETQVDEPTEVEETNGESDESTVVESAEEGEAPEAGKRSYRQERRFAKMSEKIRKLSEQQSMAASQSYVPQQVPQVPFDQEIPYDQYQSDVARQAQALTEIKLQQFRMEQQMKEQAEALDRDVDYIERKYPELNEDSPKYDPKLAAKVAGMYERLGSNNPDVRLRDLVEDVMDVASRKSTKTSAKVTATVAKQAAETAIQSETTSKPKSKSFEEMDLREMEAQLGIVE